MRNRIRVCIHPGYLLYFAACVLFLPIKIILAWMAATIIHELGHICCILLLKKEIYSVQFGVFGAQINTETLGIWQEMISAMAGPLSAIFILPFIKKFPIVTMFCILQSIYNLIPVYPMDGGRVVVGVLVYFAGRKRAIKIYIIFIMILMLLFLAGIVYISIRYSLGLLPLILIVIMIIKIKLTCKEWLQEVK